MYETKINVEWFHSDLYLKSDFFKSVTTMVGNTVISKKPFEFGVIFLGKIHPSWTATQRG